MREVAAHQTVEFDLEVAQALVVDVFGGAAGGVADHGGASGGMSIAVDEDQAAAATAVAISIEDARRAQAQAAESDLVELQLLGGDLLETVDVGAMMDGDDLRWQQLAP